MHYQNLKEYNAAQCQEIEKYKWIESEKAGHDLGEAARVEWVVKYAAQFGKENSYGDINCK